MKYIFPLIATVAALSRPWTVHSDLDLPVLLEKRLMSNTQGKKGHSKMRYYTGKDFAEYEHRSPKRGSRRADSPAKEGDTHVSAKLMGPGEVMTAREKHKNTEHEYDRQWLNPGEVLKKETRDPVWSKAAAQAMGQTPRGAATQSHLLHPAKAEGTGKSGFARAVAPPQGGYAKLKKEINGQVVQDERIPSGQTGSDTHIGSQPGEVKYTVSASHGGEARVGVNN